MPATASRRTLLRITGFGLAALAVSSCSSELRRTPWSPTQDAEGTQVAATPDVELLLAARARIARYRQILARVEAESGAQRTAVRLRAQVWPIQQERIEDLITLSGVDLPAEDAATTGSGDIAASTTGADGKTEEASSTAEPLTVLELGRALRDDFPTALAEVASATSTNRAMLASLLAEHAVSAHIFGAETDWPTLVGPSGTAAVPVLAVTRPASFGLEVVASRSTGEERERYESILAPLQAINRALTTLAEGAAPVPPLGYDLPEPLENSGQRKGLARDLVLDVAPSVLSVVDRAGSSVEQVESLVRIIVESTIWARRLDADYVPFPGMTLP